MTPERWQEIKKVLAGALERTPEERTAYLDQACAEPEMRREVESLLAAHEQADTAFFVRAVGTGEALVSGMTLGSYTVLERLGAGGMGEVYQAQDSKLDRKIAIKVLSAAVVYDAAQLARFRREARILASLNHPNICTIYDVGEQDGRQFIAMEFLDGRTLKRLISGKPLAIEQVLELGIEIAEALDAAHAGEIIHRDIKPANIFVTKRNHVKVLDFGLAKLAPPGGAANLSTAPTASLPAELTQLGAAIGTISYMSPEQVRGEELDARTDLFSFGVVLYEMATGHLPFRGETSGVVTEAILNRTPVGPVRLNPDVPAKLEEVIAKALEKDRRLRYQHACEIRADLQRVSRDAESGRAVHTQPGTSSRTVPVSVAPPKSAKRSLWIPGVIALAILASALFAANVGGLRDRVFRGASAPGIRSLAVLPLENLSGDPQQQYFADGMTEELTTELSQVGSLRVVSRTSAMRYKGTQKSVPEIARELNVDAVVEGSVERDGDRIRITAQLVQGPTDTHVWAKGYERDFRDSLRLQDEVAHAIVNEIQLKLTPQEEARFARDDVIDPEAHEDYLRGLFLLNLRDGPDERKAIDLFQAAVKKDPAYAAAYVSLADSYRALMFNSNAAPADVLPQSETAARRALEIDDQLAEAHASLATNLADFNWDWEGGEREFQTALHLNPNSSHVHSGYAHFLRQQGKTEEAIREGRRAVELDPVSYQAMFILSQCLYEARRYDEAISQLRAALDIEPRFWPAHLYLGKTLAEQGRFEEAIEELKKAGDFTAEPNATIGYVYGRMGRAADARKVIADLQEQSKKVYVAPMNFATIYIGLGDKDQAFAWLEKAYQRRDFWLTFLKGEPTFDPLRSDPRFQDLVRRIGFPQ